MSTVVPRASGCWACGAQHATCTLGRPSPQTALLAVLAPLNSGQGSARALGGRPSGSSAQAPRVRPATPPPAASTSHAQKSLGRHRQATEDAVAASRYAGVCKARPRQLLRGRAALLTAAPPAPHAVAVRCRCWHASFTAAAADPQHICSAREETCLLTGHTGSSVSRCERGESSTRKGGVDRHTLLKN